MGARLPAKTLIIMKITEVYECKSGEKPERSCSNSL